MSATRDLLDFQAEVVGSVAARPLLLPAAVASASIMFGGPILLGWLVLFLLAGFALGVPSSVLVFLEVALVCAGMALLLGAFTGSAIAVLDRPDEPVSESLARVAPRLHVLALYYLPLATGVVLTALWTLGPSFHHAHEKPSGPDPLVFVVLVFAAPGVGLAPVPIVRGERLLDALRVAWHTSRGHVALVVATTVLPAIFAAGGVVSHLLVAELRRAGSAHFAAGDFSEGASQFLAVAGILTMPFVAGVLKHAAYEVASRELVPT